MNQPTAHVDTQKKKNLGKNQPKRRSSTHKRMHGYSTGKRAAIVPLQASGGLQLHTAPASEVLFASWSFFLLSASCCVPRHKFTEQSSQKRHFMLFCSVHFRKVGILLFARRWRLTTWLADSSVCRVESDTTTMQTTLMPMQ